MSSRSDVPDPYGPSSRRDDDGAKDDKEVAAASTISYTHSKKYFRFWLLSIFFFVAGSVLYLWMAVDGLQWSKGLAHFDEYYFNQLPPKQQACAQAIGYNQELWDTGGTPEESDEWWEDLTPEQQEAAECLGYDQEKWDGYEDYIAASEEEEDATRKVDDNDYVFHVPVGSRHARVSLYMIQYFVAALCFVVVGLLDLIREKELLFPCLMITAGLFGVISAMLVERDIRISNIFNLLSVHFYFLEAIAIARHHRLKMHTVSLSTPFTFLWGFADLSFGVGALIEVVLSYFYVLDVYADFNISINGANVAAQSLWVVCSTIYFTSIVLWMWRAIG